MIRLLVLLFVALVAPRRPRPMPRRHPRIAHYLPYLFGDSLRALRWAARLGFGWIDQNGQVDKDGQVWVLHWWKFRREYPWYWTGRRTRTGREIRRRVPDTWPVTFGHISSAQVATLRSRRFGGRRPHRLATHMHVAAAVGIKLAFEAKNAPKFESPRVWKRIREDAINTGVVMVVMRLSNHPGLDSAFRVLSLAREAGFDAALLPRGPKPADWETRWVPAGIKQWGRWR